MQKHAEDPAADPSQPSVGDPRDGSDQEIDSGQPRRGKEREDSGRPAPPQKPSRK